MNIGVTAFLTDRSMTPAALAVAAEERGYHSLYLPEHTHLPLSNDKPPGLVQGVSQNDYSRSLDPFVALAAAATVTKRILLGTGVALVAQHDPITLAKQIATLDLLSEGRFVLGVGYGWNRDEAADHGVNFDARREVVADKLRCMQALWSEEFPEHHGPFVDLPPCHAWPKPIQQPRVRTLLGGGAGPKMFAAIVDHADGWMPIGGAGLGASVADLRQKFASAGRDPDTLHIVPFGTIPDHGKLAYYASLGVTEVVLRVPSGSPREMVSVLDAYLPFLVNVA